MSTAGTTDPTRVVHADEVRALVALETAERLMTKAHQALADDDGHTPDPERALLILEMAVNVTTSATCTAVKRQALSDQIAVKASLQVRRCLIHVDQVLVERSEPQGSDPDARMTAEDYADHPDTQRG